MKHNDGVSSAGRRIVRGVCLILLCILLAAVLSAGPRAPFPGTASQTADELNTQAPSGENKAVEAARIRLASQINVDVALLSVDSAERVWWPDSCLGLPGPGEVCKPIRTPGFRLVLAAGEYRFLYRTDLTGENVRLEDLTAGTAGSRACRPPLNCDAPVTPV